MAENEVQEPAEETEATAAASEGDASVSTEASGADSTSEDSLRKPEFSPLKESTSGKGNGSLNRFFDVHIPVTAELGRVEMLLGDLMKLDAGSVVRLNRPVSEPVEIVSQGVTLARGEVVVVDDCFAVRIKEIESGNEA